MITPPAGASARLDSLVHTRDRMACPDCHLPLLAEGEQLQCAQCRRTWPVVNGVPHFVFDFPYWGEIPLEQMREVNRRAESGNWKAALLDSEDPLVRRAAVMMVNLERANWQFLATIPRQSRVLDLGAGTGTNSHALALRYREVVAVEPVLERIQFMQHRFAQEALSNVSIVRSSVWTLPFERASFDLVAMNGVLEWVAEGATEDPGVLQSRALKNLLELLRPGGYLYVGIENRLALGSFLGYPDPHCRLPFVTALPRRLAHWYARRKGQPGGYRNYLYSSAGYRKILEQAGFTSVDVYLALPSYNHPRFFVPLDDRIFSYYHHHWADAPSRPLRRTLKGVLGKLGILKHMEYSFAIVARK
jgi:SAM-dependent methyltransferase